MTLPKKVNVDYILSKFAAEGVDDLELKRENENKIIIGYFHEYPVDCILIEANVITYIIFSRQDSLNWLFELYDNKIKIQD